MGTEAFDLKQLQSAAVLISVGERRRFLSICLQLPAFSSNLAFFNGL
jgi:hypothetical protein